MTAVSPIDRMTDSARAESLAVRRRRESRRQEWAEQTKLAEMLDKYLNPADTFWTSLENKPISLLSGLFQKRRGVRSGIPDQPTANQWVSVSGADPLNLVGILTPGPRLPALAGNRLLYRGGIPTAVPIADDIQFLEVLDDAKEWVAQKELLRGPVQAPPLSPATRFAEVMDAAGHHAGRRKIERPVRIASGAADS